MNDAPLPVTPMQPETGSWPSRRTEIIDWLMNETRGQRFIDNIFADLCVRLRQSGIPLARATLAFQTHHPEWLGALIIWEKGKPEAEIRPFDYDVINQPQYLNSPVYEIDSGGSVYIRQRLTGDTGPFRYPVYDEFRDKGLTDYVAWPLQHTLDKQHFISFASDAPGGFSDQDIKHLEDLLPALALVSEIRIKNRLARTFLETYVGPHASEQILAGATRRGTGVTVGAAIMICDLRGFTAISQMWPRDDVIELLNGYFDAMSEPVSRNGGEILKFMGDGLLAIFPLSNPDAASNLLRAVEEGGQAMANLNTEHARLRQEPLNYGVGVHVGDVMYGNIGSRKRLDFTVIGPAVNIASRLESLTKELHHQVLMSRAFVDLLGAPGDFQNLGQHALRGLGDPIEVFTLAGSGKVGQA